MALVVALDRNFGLLDKGLVIWFKTDLKLMILKVTKNKLSDERLTGEHCSVIDIDMFIDRDFVLTTW